MAKVAKVKQIKAEEMEEAFEELMKKQHKPKTKVQQAIDELTKALEDQAAAESQIKRAGKQIIIPEWMELLDAAEAIKVYEAQMEDDVEQILEFVGHEYELLAACDAGMRSCFGQFFGTSSMIQTFFGAMKISARNHTIPVGPNEFRTVPYGVVTVPGLPIEMKIAVKENKENKMESTLGLILKYKKKFDPLVAMMKESIDQELQKNSVFKGKAIDSTFSFIDLDSFPTDKIVYSKEMENHLNVHLFGPIENCELLERQKLNIRRSVLLHGPFGTGKTLTALVAAKCCVKNGWTFMNVIPGDDIKSAVEFANKYQPALIFFEDIEQATPRGRSADVNSILNVVDGFLTKKSKVMIIMTTNHTEKIERAMLRPGRIDAVLKMGDVDYQVMDKMIKAYCPGMTDDNIDIKRLLKAAEGYTQSFISEACHRSVLYSVHRNNDDKITTQDIEAALLGLRSQFDLMMEKDIKKRSDFEELFESLLSKTVGKTVESVSCSLDDVKGDVEEIHKAVV